MTSALDAATLDRALAAAVEAARAAGVIAMKYYTGGSGRFGHRVECGHVASSPGNGSPRSPSTRA